MSFWFFYNLAEWTIRLAMVPVILRRRFKPTTALAWLSLVFFLPELGLFFYLLVGGHRLGRKRVRLHRQILSTVRSSQRLAGQGRHRKHPVIEPTMAPVVKQVESVGGFNILGGNSVEFLQDSDTVVNRMIADIHQAQHHVHLLFYIFANDETGRRVCDALVEAQKRGVACRVLADATGSWGFFKRQGLATYLRANGVRVYELLPAAPLRRRLARLDLRNHRKLAVIDGHIAYTGSQNIVDADYGHKDLRWVDLMGRFYGPIVLQLQIVFLEDWMFETGEDLDLPYLLPVLGEVGNRPTQAHGNLSKPGAAGSEFVATVAHEVWAQTVPTGPNHETEALPRALLTAINAAQRHIVITTPYLVLDEPTMLALAMASDRGVETTIVVPERNDHPLVAAAGRAYYEELLENGIHLFRHQTGLLHAKTMTVDDSLALLGSSNLDMRSFYLNFELNVLMYGSTVTGELRRLQREYIKDSLPVDLNQWRRRSVGQRYAERAAALFSPLL